jgi:hypothetical protein
MKHDGRFGEESQRPQKNTVGQADRGTGSFSTTNPSNQVGNRLVVRSCRPFGAKKKKKKRIFS